jgi:hypothetical protein
MATHKEEKANVNGLDTESKNKSKLRESLKVRKHICCRAENRMPANSLVSIYRIDPSGQYFLSCHEGHWTDPFNITNVGPDAWAVYLNLFCPQKLLFNSFSGVMQS